MVSVFCAVVNWATPPCDAYLHEIEYLCGNSAGDIHQIVVTMVNQVLSSMTNRY